MKMIPGLVMDECGDKMEPRFYIRSNTLPEWRLEMLPSNPFDKNLIEIEADHQIEAPGVVLTVSNRAFYTRLYLNPSDAIKLGEALVELGKSALLHDYDSWQEKSVMGDITQNHPELLKKNEG